MTTYRILLKSNEFIKIQLNINWKSMKTNENNKNKEKKHFYFKNIDPGQTRRS